MALTAIGAEHTMFEDPSQCAFCGSCTKGTASQPTVEAGAEHYLTAFFARELLGDSSVGAALQGAGISADFTAGALSVASK